MHFISYFFLTWVWGDVTGLYVLSGTLVFIGDEIAINVVFIASAIEFFYVNCNVEVQNHNFLLKIKTLTETNLCGHCYAHKRNFVLISLKGILSFGN